MPLYDCEALSAKHLQKGRMQRYGFHIRPFPLRCYAVSIQSATELAVAPYRALVLALNAQKQTRPS